MKRVHVLEFEDLSWFPSWLRASMTNVLVVFTRSIGVTDVVAALVSRVLKQQKIDRIVDLGSGGGGVMPAVLAKVRADPEIQRVDLILTDLHPNPDAIETLNNGVDRGIRYLREPVDATRLASVPSGLKTMVNSFHHMRPREARAILESAQANRQPLLIYEMGANRLPLLVWCLTLPVALPIVALSVLFLNPFVRPLTLRQLFFTYVIPLIPLFYAWDGQASMPRIYTPEDLDELLEGLGSDDYRWEKGPAQNGRGRRLGTYLLGLPTGTGPRESRSGGAGNGDPRGPLAIRRARPYDPEPPRPGIPGP